MSHVLNVVEIFESIQGEGANTGLSCVFIRLAGCNQRCPFCDTEWCAGTEMSVRDILEYISKFSSDTIIWTGGEPTLQLTDEILDYFASYRNHIETNGSNPVPYGIDYVTVSPKVSPELLRDNFSYISEIRLAVAAGDAIPAIEDLPFAGNYYLSPIFDGDSLNKQNLDYCFKLIRENPKWKLSIQLHKLLKIR